MNDGKMQQQRKTKPNLAVDTSRISNHEHRSPPTPKGVRGSRDLRSPGVPKSPGAEPVAIPDFITQTDASGNATTPRSAQALSAAKQNMKRGEDDDDSSSGESTKDIMEETCDTFVDSFRMMCCCLTDLENHKASKRLMSKETQETDENAEKHEEIGRPKLLGEIHPNDTGKKCLVLDLDETLVHSSFRAVEGADFVIPVKVCRKEYYESLNLSFVNFQPIREQSMRSFILTTILLSPLAIFVLQIEDVVHFVYVAKRPGVDEFLLEMSKHYEIVIYTASLNKYADPLLDLLDIHKVIRYRLFRESCVFYEGNYVKDLSVLDRDIDSTIIIDNSPNSYLFHPENAIDCSSFIDDPKDRELDQIGSFLTGIKNAKDVRGLAPQWRDWPVVDVNEEER